jgi:hypothetical protein
MKEKGVLFRNCAKTPLVNITKKPNSHAFIKLREILNEKKESHCKSGFTCALSAQIF